MGPHIKSAASPIKTQGRCGTPMAKKLCHQNHPSTLKAVRKDLHTAFRQACGSSVQSQKIILPVSDRLTDIVLWKILWRRVNTRQRIYRHFSGSRQTNAIKRFEKSQQCPSVSDDIADLEVGLTGQIIKHGRAYQSAKEITFQTRSAYRFS